MGSQGVGHDRSNIAHARVPGTMHDLYVFSHLIPGIVLLSGYYNLPFTDEENESEKLICFVPKITQVVRGRDLVLGYSQFKPSILFTVSCCYREFV